MLNKRLSAWHQLTEMDDLKKPYCCLTKDVHRSLIPLQTMKWSIIST